MNPNRTSSRIASARLIPFSSAYASIFAKSSSGQVESADLLAGQMVPNKAMRDAIAWLEEIAATGGPGDLQLAWELWRPIADAPSVNPKLNHLKVFEAPKAQAGKRHAELRARAEEETADDRVIESLRIKLRHARQHAAAIHAEWSQATTAADRLEAEIANIERRQRGEALQ